MSGAGSESDFDVAEVGGQRSRNPTGHSMTSLQKISLAITGSMEKFFYRWGFAVATHPYKFILACLLLTMVCGLGLLNFTQENRPDRLWIARDSEFAKNTEWLRKNFPSPIRNSLALISADNVLVPEVMLALLDIHERVKEITVKDGMKWDDICFKLPITKLDSARRKRSVDKHEHNPQPIIQDSLNNDTVAVTPGTTSDTIPYEGFFGNALDDFGDAFDDDFFSDNAASGSANFDPMLSIPEEWYCSIINDLEEACWEVSPMELWSFNRSLVANLTQEDIIRAFNHQLISPVFGRSVNYSVELGGEIVKNSQGEIISAQTVMLKWAVGINQSVIETGKASADGTGEVVDETCLEWEKEWIDLMKNMSMKLPQGIQLYWTNSRSWGDISEATLFDDGLILACGFIIMFIYVGLMLGKFNVIEQRPFLTMAGLSCVGLAAVISYGVCSLFCIVYGPVNKILPFLLLGIGIDDMFVIVQCWNNLFPSSLKQKHKLSIPERMGMALKHAGVSITVTSLTDVAAFAVGASTILPGLQSFCIYAAIGIIAIFIFQATYFVAWFSLDQKRIEDRRNAFFPWIKYSEEEFMPNAWSQTSYAQNFFDNVLSKYLFTRWAKALVLLLTGGFLAVSLYGNALLRQEFDPMWFIPQNSYMSKFVQKRDESYPGIGYPAFVVAHRVNWTASFNKFDDFSEDFMNSEQVYNFENWYQDFKTYSNLNFETAIPQRLVAPAKFQKYMGKFLYSRSGSKHRAHFKLDGNFTCGKSLPPVNTVIMPFRFKKFHGPEEHIPGMNLVKKILKNANLTYDNYGGSGIGNFFAWGTGQVAWETDEIIIAELYRNVTLSLICVLITTFLLLANFRVCLFCGICVIFTLINVGGMMHFWGLTIDTVSCIDIVLGIGLCVDYAAHIGLAFMTCTGTRLSRAKQALRNIGPAVLNGGFSTFLAIILLANSQSHAFQSFFKIFTVVICFGLFHGLLFLPILLSLFGPDPYPFASSRDDEFLSFEKPSAGPKIVEMQPLSGASSSREHMESILESQQPKEAHSVANSLKQNGIYDVLDPLLTDPSHLDSLGKQI